jgi:hypothetical protein
MAAFVGCQVVKQPQVHHVLIAYPDRWNDGDRRPCFLGPAVATVIFPAYVFSDVHTFPFCRDFSLSEPAEPAANAEGTFPLATKCAFCGVL